MANMAQCPGSPQNQSNQQSQAKNARQSAPQTGLQSIDTQILMLLVSIVAILISIAVLTGVKEQQSGCYPKKDYSYLQNLARLGIALTAISAVYFAWLAWQDRKRNPGDSTLSWIFLANLAAAAAVLIKFEITYFANQNQTPAQEDDVLEEEVE